MKRQSTTAWTTIPPPSLAPFSLRRQVARSDFLVLSATNYRLCWLLISVVHVAVAGFSLIAAGVHLAFATPAVYDNTSLIWIPKGTLQLAGWSYLVVGVFHIGVWFYDVCCSVRYCQLHFGAKHKKKPSTVAPSMKSSIADTRSLASSQRLSNFVNSTNSMASRLVRFWNTYFAPTGIFGVQGPLFEAGFQVRQLIEIALQTYQAFQLSQSVPKVWISHCAVAMIVVTGASPPLIHRALDRTHPTLCRVVSLTVDLLTDLVITVVVPVCIMVANLLKFNFQLKFFPPEMNYNDIWITTAVSEARQVLVTSEIDYVSSLLPPVVCFFGLETIKTMVVRRVHTVHPALDPASVFPRPQDATARRPQPRLLNLASSPLATKTGKAVSVVCVAWVATVLAIHLQAISRSERVDDDHCILHVHSWLAPRQPCVIAHINCHGLASAGSQEQISFVLEQLDRQSLGRLIVSHCPALHMPPMVTEFARLRVLATFNCTISSWPQSAAITHTAMPMLVALDLISTNFSTVHFPEGFYHSQLPKGIFFRLLHSNLTKLPGDIGDVWRGHKWPVLWIENTQLTTIPLSFRDLTIRKLSLTGNQLTMLDEDMFITNRPARIRLSRNPLTSLPASLGYGKVDGSPHTLTSLLVEDTRITSFLRNFNRG